MTSRLRALVADDEPLARARLMRLLRADGRIEVVGECADGEQTLVAWRALRPDVVFLDVRMPGADGFGVVEAQAQGPRVVFVTAHAEYAVHAFDAQASDYLLKPLSPARLRRAIDRLCAAATAPSDRAEAPPGPVADRLVVPCGARLRVIETAHIDCLLAQANYVEICAGTERYRVRETLGGLAARLDPARFLRVHRSRIVRITAVRELELLPSGGLLLRLENGMRVASGRSHRAAVRGALGLPADTRA